MYELFRNILALRTVNHVLATALFGIAFVADHGVVADGSPVPLGSLLWVSGLLAYFGAAFVLLTVGWQMLPLEWAVPLGAAALVFGGVGIVSTFSVPGTELVRSTLPIHPFWFVGAIVCGRYMVEHYLDARRVGIV